MTAQVNDHIVYANQRYVIAGIEHGAEALFRPESFHLTPTVISTACRRGFVVDYALAPDARLVLTDLWIGLRDADLRLAQAGAGPAIEGIVPRYDPHEYCFHYAGLAHQIPYTGGLLLAHGFISSLSEHMGFHPAWKYETVHELVFHAGVLRAAYDRSSMMADQRAMLVQEHGRPGRTRRPDETMTAWIERTFDRRYTPQ